MKTLIKSGVAVIALLAAGPVAADEDADLIINDEIEITVRAEAPAHVDGLRTIYSGWVFRADETQALQMDDFENPAMLFADEAREKWTRVEGSAEKSCADCHGEPESLADARGTYPKWNDQAQEVRTLAMQVNGCRTEQMGAEAWKYDSAELLNMEALLSSVARGNPVNVAIDGPVAATFELGKEIYYSRFGQLDLSCANCHEENYGNNIRADHLSQGQINGFPTYRLKNARLNGAQTRFRGCIRDTRAETYAVGSEEFIALELYVASRGNGLSVEGPSVRN
ncbi:sulfur oxidation c-type cytochrome SoxA [Yoonia sp.]|uniref:sulfur oxidation c-type cytochrome SoxA n=1 Tax=Yoonia sp. TaxID=2212373 RepID=UPI001A0BEAF8|nr:sulfur oxidation c-type cytochrome SoxA [Yoonia sp.]MBE0412720.1 sulfur oxidation c-type cytochrome SoxA [Yoonia sp.]